MSTESRTTIRRLLGDALLVCSVGLIISVLTHTVGMAEIDQVGASVAGAMIAIALKLSRSIINGN